MCIAWCKFLFLNSEQNQLGPRRVRCWREDEFAKFILFKSWVLCQDVCCVSQTLTSLMPLPQVYSHLLSPYHHSQLPLSYSEKRLKKITEPPLLCFAWMLFSIIESEQIWVRNNRKWELDSKRWWLLCSSGLWQMSSSLLQVNICIVSSPLASFHGEKIEKKGERSWEKVVSAFSMAEARMKKKPNSKTKAEQILFWNPQDQNPLSWVYARFPKVFVDGIKTYVRYLYACAPKNMEQNIRAG